MHFKISHCLLDTQSVIENRSNHIRSLAFILFDKEDVMHQVQSTDAFWVKREKKKRPPGWQRGYIVTTLQT